MINKTCVIVGASHAGVSLALQLRREGWQGKIKLIGDEDTLPYHRPPLSKDLFAGKKNLNEIRLRPAKLYEDNEIELTLGITVNSIDRNLHKYIVLKLHFTYVERDKSYISRIKSICPDIKFEFSTNLY